MSSATGADPGTAGRGGQHQPWCVLDVLHPGGQWHCCSAGVDLSLGPPGGSLGAAAGTVSVFLAQGPYDIRPRLWLAHGDIARGDRLDAAELTVAEARKLVQVLTDAIALATPAGPPAFTVVPGASLPPPARYHPVAG